MELGPILTTRDVPGRVGSQDELLERSDLIVIASPNQTHFPIAKTTLEAGKHMVVDKPFTISVEEADELIALAAERQRMLTVFHNRRWDGDFLTVQRLVRSGALGQVTRFESRFERFRPEIKEGWREQGDPAEGGGVLLDLGPHLVDQAIQLFGPPETVYGEVITRREGALVDDDAFIALTHAGGEISHLWMSVIAPLHDQRFRVSGMERGFAVSGLDPQEEQLREGMRPGDPGFGEKKGLEPGHYLAFYEGVREWANGGAAAPVDPWDAVRVLEVLEQARSVRQDS